MRRVFDYRPPSGFVGANVDAANSNRPLRPGVRVRVPFGRRQLIGILVGIVAESTVAAAKLKTALDILDAEPIFDPATLDLLFWAAEYYHHSQGEVFAAALPASLRAGQAARARTVWWSLKGALSIVST